MWDVEGKMHANEGRRPELKSSPERLAYWYLRLNGFLLLENFVVHPDTGNDQRTDADLLGVRFQHRSENLVQPMRDDAVVAECTSYCNVVIAEVKRGECKLNGPWTTPEKQDIDRVLSAIGCVAPTDVRTVAGALYQTGRYDESDLVTIRLLAFGDRPGALQPDVPQIYFDHMLKFMHERFRTYRRQKAAVGNWARDGQRLRQLSDRLHTFEEYRAEVRPLFGLDAGNLRERGYGE